MPPRSRPAGLGRVAAPVLTELGSLPVGRFLREYWQRRPLLIRAAFPGLRPVVDRAQLFALAGRDEVESRLVLRRGSRWTLRHGPFDRDALPGRSQKRWTLLVQGLESAHDGARELLSRFRFVPDARLDDLMASYATDGGGVGPHVDQYDVFLLQVAGLRRWRISRQRHARLVPSQPLRLLTDFRPTQEWLLEPGDMLYLPPGVPHEGVAEGECITYSIGFRAPAWQELLDPWLAHFAESVALRGRYRDAGASPTRRPAALPPRLLRAAHAALSARRPSRAATERFLLEYLSEPKPQVVFAPRATRPVGSFARAVARQGLRLDRRSRMLWSGTRLAINGECVGGRPARSPLLRRLADERALPGSALARAPADVLALLQAWHAAGWITLGMPT